MFRLRAKALELIRVISPRVRYPAIAMKRTFLALSLALAGCSQSQETERPPNFVIVFCDNLGYGDVEPFGSTLHRTPALNRMAEEGRKFTHFYVTSGVCTPSRASLMTGCYAQRVGMHVNERDDHVLRPASPYGLHPDEVTVAEILKQRGYATTIIGKGEPWGMEEPLVLASPKVPLVVLRVVRVS